MKGKEFYLSVPFTDSEIDDIVACGARHLIINKVSVKRESSGYYQSRTTNAVVRLIIMLVNGRIYSLDRDENTKVGKLMENPARFVGEYKYRHPKEYAEEYAAMSGEPLYRASDIGDIDDFLYLCAIAQLYVLNIRQT